MLYLIVAPRNLEDICERELNGKNISIIKRGYRKLLISYCGDPDSLSCLRTPDDILVFLKEFKDKKHYTGRLDNIYKQIKDINLHEAVATCRKVRTLSTDLTFSVTASIIGKRRLTQDFLKKTIAKNLSSDFMKFKSGGKPDLDFFIMIENENVCFGLRLFKEPLHKRDYKRYSLPASLKSNIAYCMLELAKVMAGDSVLDPMCGVGTISLEASFMGAKAIGLDKSREAIQLAKKNARKANKLVVFEQGDTTCTNLSTNSIDKIVTNLPFGKQIDLISGKSFFIGFLKEASRILKKDGRIVLLTVHHDLIYEEIGKLGLALEHKRRIALFGLQPYILILIHSKG
ncbi:MAG: methyltransferase domain-containing protein [Candidatus Woesearchaeota archaeon]